MRQNYRRIFHKVIIASVCCMALAGCGHKTNPRHVPDVVNAPAVAETNTSIKG